MSLCKQQIGVMLLMSRLHYSYTVLILLPLIRVAKPRLKVHVNACQMRAVHAPDTAFPGLRDRSDSKVSQRWASLAHSWHELGLPSAGDAR